MKAPKSIDIPSKSGGFVVREVGRLVLATTTHHTALAPALWPITERLLELAPPGVDLAYAMPSGDWTEPGPRKKLARHVANVAKWPMNGSFSIASLASNIDFEIGYSGCAPVWTKRGWSSELRVTFARERIYAAPDAIVALLRDVLALAPWTTATLGLALEGNEWKIHPLAKRYPAVDISDPGSCSHDLADRAFGIAWLTAISAAHVKALGGEKKLAAKLGSRVTMCAAPGGVIVRLGPVPRRGATAAERAPYEALAKAIEPVLHRPAKVLYMSSHALQRAWHERFLHPHAAYASAFRNDDEDAAPASPDGPPF